MTSDVHTVDRTFRSLGTDVRLVVTAPDAAERVRRAEAIVHEHDARLSRFRPDSELTALNADVRETVPASGLLRDAVRAALWAARASGGLVDPTLLDALEEAGYRTSLAGVGPPAHLPPPGAGAGAGGSGPARPDQRGRWRAIRVGKRSISRPPGVRLDLGGTGKGHAADRVAAVLAGAERWAVDCGGDVRVGGTPQPVLVAHPLRGGMLAAFHGTLGAVATSSVLARAWRRPDGRRAHHLLDPATGEPASTGLLSATALAPTVLEAETLAKTALLSGPGGARRTLAAAGGLLVHSEGAVEHVERRRAA